MRLLLFIHNIPEKIIFPDKIVVYINPLDAVSAGFISFIEGFFEAGEFPVGIVCDKYCHIFIPLFHFSTISVQSSLRHP